MIDCASAKSNASSTSVTRGMRSAAMAPRRTRSSRTPSSSWWKLLRASTDIFAPLSHFCRQVVWVSCQQVSQARAYDRGVVDDALKGAPGDVGADRDADGVGSIEP